MLRQSLLLLLKREKAVINTEKDKGSSALQIEGVVNVEKAFGEAEAAVEVAAS